MAKVFLGLNNTITLSNSNTVVKGKTNGDERIFLREGVSAVTADADVEAINFSGTLSSYHFKVTAGAGIQVFDTNGLVITTIQSINADAMKIAFADGTADLVQTGGSAFSLGGQAVSTTDVAAITSISMGSNFDTAVTSLTNMATSLLPSSETKVFLDVNDHFIVNDSSVLVKGRSGGNEKITIGVEGLSGITTDADIEAIDLSAALSNYRFKVTAGEGIQVFDANDLLITTVQSINADAMKIAFADGTADLVQTGGSAFSLGGQPVSTTSTMPITSDAMGGKFDTAATSVVNGGTTTIPTEAPSSSINVTAAGTYLLTNAADTINITTGNYDASIQGFAVGDKIDLPTSFLDTLTLLNHNGADRLLILQGNDETGNTITLTLTGISTTADASIYNIASFQTVFGTDSLF